MLLGAHHALWRSLFFVGDLRAAREHFAARLALYDPDQHASLASMYGHHDAGVCGRAIGALALELLGESEQATRDSEDAIRLARRLGHPFSEIQALLQAAFLQRERGDWQRPHRLAEAGGGAASERGFVALAARATTINGWAMTQAGAIEDGITQMEEGIETLRSVLVAFLPYLLGALAEGHAKAGHVQRALDVIAEALAAVETSGERFYEAELLRLRGELLVVGGHSDMAAEQCFRSALNTAHRQRARTLERRAAKSLSQLLERQGRNDEARRLAESGP